MKSSLFFLLIANLWGSAYAADDNPMPTVERGAKVYYERCTLCHGNGGKGNGILAIKLKDYPNTDLLNPNKTFTKSSIRKAVLYGAAVKDYLTFMPPFGHELNWTDGESVVLYVMLLRAVPKRAQKLILAIDRGKSVNLKYGEELFKSRCILCHGAGGEGNGRMSRIIKSPPPANLVKSRLADEQLDSILKKGGQGVGRSPQMPPWGDQFNEAELSSVKMFIKSLRK